MNIKITSDKEAQRIAQFQINMAKQTESLDLNPSLVFQAVKYLINHPESGFYLGNKPKQQITGSLLCTFENDLSWWIQSVYVDKQFRKQGIFTSLFRDLIKVAADNKVKVVSLYAQETNQQALTAYKKLGMHVTKEKLYGYDFVYSDAGKQELHKCVQGKQDSFSFKLSTRNTKAPQEVQKFTDLLGNKTGINHQVGGFDKQGKLCLYAEYFQEYSDWRFGRMFYISSLLVRDDIKLNQSLPELVIFLSEKMGGLKVQAVRFLQGQGSNYEIAKHLPGVERLHYVMVRINL